MYRVLSSLVALAWIAQLGCSDDSFKRNEPRLELVAYLDGQSYRAVDDATHLIDLGEVPVFATKWAVWKMVNDTRQPLNVFVVGYGDTVGIRWNEPRWIDPAKVDDPGRPFRGGGQPFKASIPPYGAYLLGIPYAPLAEGEHRAVVRIESDAANAQDGAPIEAIVKATGVYTGEPDLEIEYNAYRGPTPSSDCVDVDTDGIVDGCVIPIASALDFGNIGLGETGTVRLILRNKAECTAYPGVDACTLCGLTVAKDETRQNIGLGFKPGTNDAGYFEFAGSTSTPFDIQQRNVDPSCNASGEVRILVNFKAPNQEGAYSATIVVESNDPDEPLIEIPVRGAARNAPIAIAKFRAIDPLNPTAPYTNPSDIEPLERVYFDGRDSYDPLDPGNPARIAAFQWEIVEYPVGTDPGMFQHQGQTSSLYSFWLPVAGHYEVKLTVWNVDGLQSGDTASSRVAFDCIPGDALHVQLVWDNATNDQDLHMVYANQDDRVCNRPWDCHWLNRSPVWFSSHAASAGPNPTLDIDDTNGLGPENINIDAPEPGTYRVYVHYFGDFNTGAASPTRNTIRIYLNGQQVAEYRRTLTVEKAVWAVADITWLADGTGLVTPYPSDAAGQIGAVGVMQSCTSPGWTFQ